MNRILTVALAVALSPCAVRGAALTLDDALERARRDAPAIVAARLRPDEARGRLAGASVLLRDNPVVSAAGGRRDGERGVSTDIETDLTQTFELGGRRRSRIVGARAEVEREVIEAEDTTRRVLSEVSSAFLRALASDERVRILRQNEEVARDLLGVTDRRHEAGDVADLDVNIARVAASRAHAEFVAAAAARDLAVRDLKVALGMDAAESVELGGDLRQRRVHPLPELLHAAADRADLRALADDVRVADAEAQLGDGFRWPDLGVRVGYKREEGADIPLAGISLALPLFVNGQEQRVTGSARARRLRVELAARRKAVEVEVRAAFDAHAHLVDGVEHLERQALPLLDENDSLARRGYKAGELGISDYLVVQRETLGTRLDYVDRSLEAALAALELETRAGVLR